MTFPYLLIVTGKGSSLLAPTDKTWSCQPQPMLLFVVFPVLVLLVILRRCEGLCPTQLFFFCHSSWSHIHTRGNVIVIEKRWHFIECHCIRWHRCVYLFKKKLLNTYFMPMNWCFADCQSQVLKLLALQFCWWASWGLETLKHFLSE